LQFRDALEVVHVEGRSDAASGGVIAESVCRAKDDPDNVLVLHSFETMAAAEAFFASPELRDAMQKAGGAVRPGSSSSRTRSSF
jgi:hypothetical protein